MTTANTRKIPMKMRLFCAGIHAASVIAPDAMGRFALRLFATPQKRKSSPPEHFMHGVRLPIPFGQYCLAGYMWGDGDKIALLVHGWSGDANDLQAFIPPLLKQGYRVVAFDAPAHGRSPGKQCDINNYAASIRSVLKHFHPVDAIIAHSFGGAATMTTLATYDQSAVKKVVLIGSPSDLGVMTRRFGKTIGLTDQAGEAFQHYLAQRLGRRSETFNPSTSIPATPVDGLIIHDEQDSVVPYSQGASLASQWNSARLITTQGLGHRRILHNDDVIQKVVAFVTHKAELPNEFAFSPEILTEKSDQTVLN
jgi:pimeloyl-ACP methyl ester carboxylesterase